MNKKVKQGLEICYKTANILKEKYPSEIMKIQNDTILPFSKENIKRKKFLAGKKSMGLSYAFYTNYKPHRIIIKQKILKNPSILRTKIKNQKDRKLIDGNFALIELMCHELAHHRTKGHAKGFKIKYKKFLLYMINSIISGYFYYE
tara:strand:- start:2022 stop:2459 length:438 start_codon:yes stop_codon:yes gene_type:complete